MIILIDEDKPIRQGDIFHNLPKLELDLGPASLPTIYQHQDIGPREVNWFQWTTSGGEVYQEARVRLVTGIVISQDCDNQRAFHIAFCEIKPLPDVEDKYHEGMKLTSFTRVITIHSRRNQKYFYLAKDNRIGFDRKMGVDFQSVFEVRREMLEKYISELRIGRLEDETAWPHFRERVAEYFRRYPYDEWYPFTPEEVNAYEDDKKIEVTRYSWQ